MITINECISFIEKKDPNVKIIDAKDYGSDYLLTYSYKGYDNIPDPFLLINKKTGLVKTYTIAEDSKKFYSTPSIPIHR